MTDMQPFAERVTVSAELKCALCRQERPLRKSHVIPEFMFGPLYDGKHRFWRVSNVASKQNRRGMTVPSMSFLILLRDCPARSKSRAGAERDGVRRFGPWLDLPIPLRFLRQHQLAISVVEQVRAGMSKLRGNARCVMNMSQAIAGIGMAQAVLRPTRETGCLAHTRKFAPCSNRNDVAFHHNVRS